jgi:signal peptidase I
MTRQAGEPPRYRHQVRETLVSIIIAFAMAFLFRGFVIEAFLIPTGSMAPTLLGQHMRFRSRHTGYSWAADTRDRNPNTGEPFPVQGLARGAIVVHDPMSGAEVSAPSVPVRWGDRIFVMKYLYSVYDPERFDVVVFKNPTDPTQNFIKRLIGLPGEQVALVDGDVFVRRPRPDDTGNPWMLPGWRIARKPDRAQRAMWQPVFSSEYTARQLSTFRSPWAAASEPALWRIGGRPVYEYAGDGPSAIVWDSRVRPIDDSYAYNEVSIRARQHYPVSDVRVSFGLRPQAARLSVGVVLLTRGHEFRAEILGSEARLRMRRAPDGEWLTLGRTTLAGPLPRSEVTNVEFWHVDQSLSLFINDVPVIHGEYEWGPDERLRHTIGMGADEVATAANALTSAEYPVPVVRLEFSAGPLTLYRVALARDIHYRPDLYHGSLMRPHTLEGQPARATHPASTRALTASEYFFCGDNSPASLDGRLADVPSPYVQSLDADLGVVHRDLLIGKAFWVYFPAPERRAGLPVPDFGRMRFIW